jgi:hypothetical protein
MKQVNKSYPIFCIAAHLLSGREDELDLVWEDAIKLYAEFTASEFNDYNKSELDCINDFLNLKK